MNVVQKMQEFILPYPITISKWKNKESNILMARVALAGACRAISCTIICMATDIENHYPNT